MEPTYLNPKGLKHRSDTVVFNGVAYVSGVVPADNSVTIADQTRQALAQIDERLAAAGTDKSRLLSATIWMHDVNRDVAAFNEAWNSWLVARREPARACVQATLQGGAQLEISVIAAMPSR
ncbi:RidA family protein [Bosea sp. (in: a-proteobacteria)]|uniref:RidA family protein n=1 Tax=Bosea sp. (in: a-proteobacteria) TaxID=1871050 RepID=UPI001AC33F5E|nr:RidA family protein [Bosea sp. (in: a-proteobacteria)]MBN9438230.1 RidA family protein [Bosea sp. (in: a-proteobacteria)]